MGLNLTFSVVNNSKKQAWTTFRVMNSTGTMYRPGGTGSELTVNLGETGSKTIFTDKYDVGSDDLTLIVSARQLGETHRVVKEEIPLDNSRQVPFFGLILKVSKMADLCDNISLLLGY